MANTLEDKLTIKQVQRMDRGLSYAESCFETFRVIQGHIFCWSEHWQRLSTGMASFGIALPPSHASSIQDYCLNIAHSTADDCLIRLSVSGGEASWGLTKAATPQFYVQSMVFKAQTQPLHTIALEYPFALNPKIAKFTADYAQSLRALHAWQSELSDGKQGIVCKDGQLISGTSANILLYRQGKWFTPDTTGILSGIIRQFLLQHNLVIAQVCPQAWLDDCEAMLLCNSGQFLSPVQSINGRNLTLPHPASQAIQQILQQQQGVSLAHL